MKACRDVLLMCSLRSNSISDTESDTSCDTFHLHPRSKPPPGHTSANTLSDTLSDTPSNTPPATSVIKRHQRHPMRHLPAAFPITYHPRPTPATQPSATTPSGHIRDQIPPATPTPTPWQHLPTSSAIKHCHQHPIRHVQRHPRWHPPTTTRELSRSPTPRLEVRTPVAKAIWEKKALTPSMAMLKEIFPLNLTSFWLLVQVTLDIPGFSLSLSLSLCTALAGLCPPFGRAGADKAVLNRRNTRRSMKDIQRQGIDSQSLTGYCTAKRVRK